MTKGAKKGKDGPSTSSPHTSQLLTQVFCMPVSAHSMIEQCASVACIHCNYSSIQMLQVNYLREELQMLSKSNHVAIVTVDGRPG